MTNLTNEQMMDVLIKHFGFNHETSTRAPRQDGDLMFGDIRCNGCSTILGNYTGWGEDTSATIRKVRGIFAAHQVEAIRKAEQAQALVDLEDMLSEYAAEITPGS